MSYVLLMPPSPGILPTLISALDLKYPELICAGYTELDRGWRWEMTNRLEELTANICETII